MNTFAFTTVDFVVIAIIAISAITGLLRGLIREAISLVGFALSMYFAYSFSGVVAMKWLTAMPGGATAQFVTGFIAIFIIVLVLSKMIGGVISRIVNSVGLSFLDRLLGAIFGIMRGGLIVVVLSTLFALTDIPKSNEWKDALTRPAVDFAVGVVRSWLPSDWAEQLKDATDIRKVP
jgi:membrane protein required for colicin V production